MKFDVEFGLGIAIGAMLFICCSMAFWMGQGTAEGYVRRYAPQCLEQTKEATR